MDAGVSPVGGLGVFATASVPTSGASDGATQIRGLGARQVALWGRLPDRQVRQNRRRPGTEQGGGACLNCSSAVFSFLRRWSAGVAGVRLGNPRRSSALATSAGNRERSPRSPAPTGKSARTTTHKYQRTLCRNLGKRPLRAVTSTGGLEPIDGPWSVGERPFGPGEPWPGPAPLRQSVRPSGRSCSWQ